MSEKKKLLFLWGIKAFLIFAVFTVFVKFFDVKAIGPKGTVVGFGTLNGFVHNLTGVNMALYTITDWLGLVPIGLMSVFAVIGLVQLVKRRSLLKVDKKIIALGFFYIAVLSLYLFFESFAVNYRPVLIDGFLEASYPSSTTLLVLSVYPSSIFLFKEK